MPLHTTRLQGTFAEHYNQPALSSSRHTSVGVPLEPAAGTIREKNPQDHMSNILHTNYTHMQIHRYRQQIRMEHHDLQFHLELDVIHLLIVFLHYHVYYCINIIIFLSKCTFSVGVHCCLTKPVVRCDHIFHKHRLQHFSDGRQPNRNVSPQNATFS